MPKLRSSYQLHIQLCDIKPAIWRRVIVADTITLAQLHRTIQAAMGWDNRHSYAFEIAGQRYGLPDADSPEDPTMDARRYTLGQLLQGQVLALRYHYDFGDDWQHRIKVEACVPVGSPEALHSLPLCVGGRNACPPEDCGGAPGFADWLQAMHTPEHPLHPSVRHQHPEGFDAKLFELHAAQARIHALGLLRPATTPSTKVEAPAL